MRSCDCRQNLHFFAILIRSSPATNKTILAAKEELEKLKAEKQDLETKLDGFISLYAEKQTQLQAIMEVTITIKI